jgi:hypothetical protein
MLIFASLVLVRMNTKIFVIRNCTGEVPTVHSALCPDINLVPNKTGYPLILIVGSMVTVGRSYEYRLSFLRQIFESRHHTTLGVRHTG